LFPAVPRWRRGPVCKLTGLRNKGHALITGGSSGIGLAIAHNAARAGHAITLIARRVEQLQAAADTIRATHSVDVQTFSADLGNRAEAERSVGDAIAQFGAPTHVVTSAGQAIPGYFSALDIDVFENLNAVNYLGTVYTIKAAFPHMRAAGGGRIGIISSGAGLVGIFGYTAYGATKYAVRGFGECLRAEARRDNISVTIAYPPDTGTPQLSAEELVRPPETAAIAGGAAVWAADRVATLIWRGMDARKLAVTPGWEMTALYRFQSLLDPALRWTFDRLADRAKRP